MKRGIRFFVCFIGVVMLIALSGCEKKGKIVGMEMPTGDMIGELPEHNGPGPNQNLLTGIDDLSEEAIGKRPVAIMVNNVEPALPQYGVGQADVIFELPVEGKLTRLMALYADYTKIPEVCAIRSCRYYYPAIAHGFDAIYVHWGSDQTIIDYVDSMGIDRYDGMRNPHGLYGRDQDRRAAGYSTEHTGYFKGPQFAAAVKEDGKRINLLESKDGTAFRFSTLGETITPSGEACTQAHIAFGAATATFDYDEKKQVYTKKINGHDHIDGKTEETLSFTNVFVLETSISVRDAKGHLKIDWAGSSDAKGYYISNGAVEEITWSKEDGQESGYLKFYTKSGKELVINRGKSYIAYTDPGALSLQ